MTGVDSTWAKEGGKRRATNDGSHATTGKARQRRKKETLLSSTGE